MRTLDYSAITDFKLANIIFFYSRGLAEDYGTV